jgi:hypothetical protein
LANLPKDSQNILGGLDEEKEANMKFPKRLRYKGKGRVLATIYKNDHPTQPYTLYWRVRIDGKPRTRLKAYSTYAAAKKAGEQKVSEIATGKLSQILSPGQTTDALAALERVQSHYQSTGRRVSLLAGISAFCEADAKLNGRLLADAVEGFLSTVASVKRKDLKKPSRSSPRWMNPKRSQRTANGPRSAKAT